MTALLYIANVRLPTDKAYGIQIASMCEAFADRGVRVDLVTPTRKNRIVQDFFSYYETKKNFRIVRLFSPDFYLPGSLDRIAVLTKNFISAVVLALYALSKRADIVYSRDELPLYLMSFFKKNLVFEAHKYSPRRRVYYRRFRKAGIKVIAISQGIRDELIRFGYQPEKVLVVRDGVDLSAFTISKTKTECRELLGLPQDKILVVYTGHLYEWKGAQVLAEAAKHLDKRYVVVFVGGTEEDVARYKKIYEGTSIMFLGWRPHNEIPLYLKAADLVVLPNSGKETISRVYTSPLKMFEYMASGTPIVASDLPSIREVLSEKSAFFSPPDNPEKLASVINEVVAHIPESEKRGFEAQRMAAQHSWLLHAGQILQFIKG